MSLNNSPSEDGSHTALCGVVMPIADWDNCTAVHWADVLDIIRESLKESSYQVELVSSADASTVIHGNIIENLSTNPIVICDVSGRNPNVMFELGIRLAFDLPTVVIKDDVTPYNFDTSPIQHLNYPRDLRFNKIKDFQRELITKVQATLEAAKDPQYSSFLKYFSVAKLRKVLPTSEVEPFELLLKEVKNMKGDLSFLKSSIQTNDASHVTHAGTAFVSGGPSGPSSSGDYAPTGPEYYFSGPTGPQKIIVRRRSGFSSSSKPNSAEP